MATGLLVMASAKVTSPRLFPVESIRRISPSVTIPRSRPAPLVTKTAPRFLRLSSATAACMVTVTGTDGTLSPVSITSPTATFSRSPRLPPGWLRRKSSARNFLRLSRTTARASPMASVAVVEVVGARPSGQASLGMATSSVTTACRDRVESATPHRAMIDTPRSLRLPSRRFSSAVSPEYERARTTSVGATMPRSPCMASTGWRKKEGVPVELRVATIF